MHLSYLIILPSAGAMLTSAERCDDLFVHCDDSWMSKIRESLC